MQCRRVKTPTAARLHYYDDHHHLPFPPQYPQVQEFSSSLTSSVAAGQFVVWDLLQLRALSPTHCGRRLFDPSKRAAHCVSFRNMQTDNNEQYDVMQTCPQYNGGTVNGIVLFSTVNSVPPIGVVFAHCLLWCASTEGEPLLRFAVAGAGFALGYFAP